MRTYVHNLHDTTVKELTTGVSIVHALHQVYAIATSLNDDSLAVWAQRELSGYPRNPKFPGFNDDSCPKYRLTSLTIRASFHQKVKVGHHQTSIVVDLAAAEKHHSITTGQLSQYFISKSLQDLEKLKKTGVSLVQIPDVKGLLSSFRSKEFPLSVCKSYTAFISANSYEQAIRGIRLEAIRRLMETGLGRDPLQGPPLIHLENTMKDSSTNIHNPGGQVGNVVVKSSLTNSSASVGEQQLNIERRTESYDETEERQFREDVKQVLHLLVDRYEEIKGPVYETLQQTLLALREIELQGKNLTQIEDTLGDIWAKQEVTAMKVPEFVQDAIAATKVLKELGGKLAGLTAALG